MIRRLLDLLYTMPVGVGPAGMPLASIDCLTHKNISTGMVYRRPYTNQVQFSCGNYFSLCISLFNVDRCGSNFSGLIIWLYSNRVVLLYFIILWLYLYTKWFFFCIFLYYIEFNTSNDMFLYMNVYILMFNGQRVFTSLINTHINIIHLVLYY